MVAPPKLPPAPDRDTLTTEETDFLAARDSFYMATVTEDAWPYVQHPGGPPGFVKVLGPNQLGFADFGGNRQMISTGNLAVSDRVALFFMDYPRKERLKLLGHVRVLDARGHPQLADQLSPTPALRGSIARLFLIDRIRLELPKIHYAALHRSRGCRRRWATEAAHLGTGTRA